MNSSRLNSPSLLVSKRGNRLDASHRRRRAASLAHRFRTIAVFHKVLRYRDRIRHGVAEVGFQIMDANRGRTKPGQRANTPASPISDAVASMIILQTP
jgi:hypothetical protein